MKAERGCLPIAFLLVVGTFGLLVIVIPENAEASTLFVGGTGPGNYTTIQNAIDAAVPGDNVYVYSGIYYEQVSISKSISLIGEHRDTTLIDGLGLGDVINVTADWVNITGFKISNNVQATDRAGIALDHAHNVRISDNIVRTNGWHGILLHHSENNTIENNIIEFNRLYGIVLRYSHSNTISNNNISSNREHGILFLYSHLNTVQHNSLFYNEHWGMIYRYSNRNVIANNHIFYHAGNCIWIWSSHYNAILNNIVSSKGQRGIILSLSNNNTIAGNDVSLNRWDGIFMQNSHRNTVQGNHLWSNTAHGIISVQSDYNTISGNIVANNPIGIALSSSDNSSVFNNLISDNRYGISCGPSYGSTIYHNNILDNEIQARDSSGLNQWDDGYPSGGNYWSNYTGIDSMTGPNQNIPGSDGLGDSPFIIESNATDEYPLMSPIDDIYSPLLTILSPADGQSSSFVSITVTGTALDLGDSGLDRVEIRVNAGTWIVAMGTSSWSSFIDLGPGANVVEAKAFDNSGNPSIIQLVSVYYSPQPNTPPVATFSITPLDGDLSTIFKFDSSSSSDTTDPLSVLEVRWDWEDDGLWDTSWSTAKTAQHQFADPGTYATRLEVKDTGGLIDSSVKQVTVTDSPVVNQPPVCMITSPEPGDSLSGNHIFEGAASDSDGLVEIVEIRIDNGNWLRVNGRTTWNFLWNTSLVANGQHTLYARSYDGIDYSTHDEVAIVVDNAPVEEADVGSDWWPIVATLIIVNLILLALLVVVVRTGREEEEVNEEVENQDET